MKTLDDEILGIKNQNFSKIDIVEMLKDNKKIVSFIGAGKCGTSFLVNNIARILSNNGVDVAILDATQNSSGTYYTCTRNNPKICKKVITSIDNLTRGILNGIKIKNNLTIYTSLPGTKKNLQNVNEILETLIKNHTLILIDCDNSTPVDFFSYVQEFYLVQSMDISSIPFITKSLLDIENKGIYIEAKLKIIINKFLNLKDITEQKIISGLAFYNEPNMSYMKQLFDKNTVEYTLIPFDEEVYKRYLEEIANYDINMKGYPKYFVNILEELANYIY